MELKDDVLSMIAGESKLFLSIPEVITNDNDNLPQPEDDVLTLLIHLG